MLTMIKNAWTGWQQMSEAGKLLGLLLAIILSFALLCIIGLKRKSLKAVLADMGGIFSPEDGAKGMSLVAYTSAMLAWCIFPVTAVILMIYQTGFYEYKWIFSYIPVTLVSSLGVSALISIIWNRNKSKMGILKAGAASIGILFVIFLCGAGRGEGQDETPMVNYQKTERLLDILQDKVTDDIYMWGCRDAISAVRQVSADVRLLYGRNMWDKALDAYAYDQYGEDVEEMYLWMEESSLAAEEDAEGRGCIEKALSYGVNVIVLSRNASDGAVREVADVTGGTLLETEEYYIFIVEGR